LEQREENGELGFLLGYYFIGSSNTPRHAAEQGGVDNSEEKRATASCYPPCEEEDEDELPRVDISSKG
jgi:hypothetical protein